MFYLKPRLWLSTVRSILFLLTPLRFKKYFLNLRLYISSPVVSVWLPATVAGVLGSISVVDPHWFQCGSGSNFLYQCGGSLKGQCHEIFCFWFFLWISFHPAPAANFAISSPCAVDTGGKFATGVNDTGGKFAAGVVDTGGKQWEQYQAADTLKWSWRQKFIYMVTLLPKGAQTKLLKFFSLKIFSICHRCRWHRWCTLSRVYLCEFSKKFEKAVLVYSDACGKLIHEKNHKSKISWHCPFNHADANFGQN